MTDFTTEIRKAQRAVETNDLASALEIATRLREDPSSLVSEDFHLVYYVLSVARFREAVSSGHPPLETIDKCISTLEKSIDLNPDHADSSMMMGQMYFVKAEQPQAQSVESYLAARIWFEKASELGDPWPAEYCRPQLQLIESRLEEGGQKRSRG
jgi:hypothetical protein